MEVLASGKVDYSIISDVGKKSGKPYKCIKIKFGTYELSTPLFLTEDQYLLIKLQLDKKPL